MLARVTTRTQRTRLPRAERGRARRRAVVTASGASRQASASGTTQTVLPIAVPTADWTPATDHPWVRAARETFGTTGVLQAAGYLLPDGDLLDLSGGHAVRAYDHRTLGDVVGAGGTAAMRSFMAETGAVRVHGDAAGGLFLDVERPLTLHQQRTILASYVPGTEFVVDAHDPVEHHRIGHWHAQAQERWEVARILRALDARLRGTDDHDPDEDD
jgi:hypothetical protein